MIRNLPPRDGAGGELREFESPAELQRRLEGILKQKFGDGVGREVYIFSRMRNVKRVSTDPDELISWMNTLSDNGVRNINTDNLERIILDGKRYRIEYDYYDDLGKWTDPNHFTSDFDAIYCVQSRIRNHILTDPPEGFDTAESLREKIRLAQAAIPPAVME